MTSSAISSIRMLLPLPNVQTRPDYFDRPCDRPWDPPSDR